ncbi:MAG: peptide chain release factor N(5)-glutamine methyltransferase [Lachnospiraceae bacterium]|nr:peptide chain release factor N(5)-glutamine methyltransferase [Lachnospiraceae bacterium]
MEYRNLYETGKKRLCEAGIEEADLDARLLLEYVCGTDRNTLLVHGDRLVSEKECSLFEACIAKREKRIPLQYITGEQEFMGLKFAVNENVLIPRQDTEILVEEVLKDLHDGMSVLDMCTGSGCILLSLLQYSNDCEGTGVDISEKALETARENAGRLSKDPTFIRSDLFEKVEGKYDVIVSNPPYIPTKVIPTLMSEVKEYEPIEALDGKEDGLYFYKEIIRQAGEYLNRGGKLFFEIGCEQAEEVSGFLENAGYKEVEVVKDFTGLDRVVFGTYLP